MQNRRIAQRVGPCLLALALFGGVPPASSFAADKRPAATATGDETDAVGRTSVVILPFVPVADEEGSTWIGQAIGQTLTSDLSIDSSLSVTLAGKGASEADAALKAGKRAKAQYVVFGTYQEVEDQIRITGGILSVETGKSFAGLKATGAVRDLFSLEDTLTHQVQLRLKRAEEVARAPESEDDSPAPAEATQPAKKTAHETTDDADPDPFADARMPASPTIGIRRGAARDPDDWDNADLDRLAFSDAGRAARIRYFYEDPYYAFPGYFGGYGYSAYSSGFGYGGYGYGYGGYGGYGYGYSPYRVRITPGRINGWPDGDATAGYGNTPGGVRMTLRAPGAYGGSRALDGYGPVHQPVRTGGGVHVTVRSAPKSHK